MSFVLKDVTVPAGSMTMAGYKLRSTLVPVRLDEANTHVVAYRCFQMIFIKRGNMTMVEMHGGNKAYIKATSFRLFKLDMNAERLPPSPGRIDEELDETLNGDELVRFYSDEQLDESEHQLNGMRGLGP
ncbi:hypothetical protein Ctob_015965 [Chrysochromulina tobinii]|uniref:Uncharacterized protein n=1 Tax=Chrysochromulina tobinii TaxID=1460289 RepID=A0A0M0K369_9EUKA|nr:hypothetical protein Ctob_015965 [Chrysochromulina tobinii]|eukprot:KOO33316.1 hypothetical protein Ctob_015965 [Chrysochromulina sp. CCMP291]